MVASRHVGLGRNGTPFLDHHHLAVKVKTDDMAVKPHRAQDALLKARITRGVAVHDVAARKVEILPVNHLLRQLDHRA